MRYDRAPCLGDAMFSTLLGALPVDPSRPAAAGDEAAGQLDDVSALAATGLDLISDGSVPADPAQTIETTIARWQAAAAASAVPAKAVLLGPFSSARSSGGEPLETADRLRATIVALAAAGCPLVEIAEPDALAIASDPIAAAAFAAAHRRLVDGTEGIHASLALTGGNLDGTPPAVLFDPAYASYAFDLIAGPDNWRLIVQAPGDRGIVCGALDLAPGADESRELLVWAAHYAASTNGRGLARVGLANAPTVSDAPTPARSDVLRKLAVVAEASRIAAVESGEEMASLLDPRAIDTRSAAMGRFAPFYRRGRTGR
jgi:hypothetical protein